MTISIGISYGTVEMAWRCTSGFLDIPCQQVLYIPQAGLDNMDFLLKCLCVVLTLAAAAKALTSQEIESIIDSHNELRSSVSPNATDMMYMVSREGGKVNTRLAQATTLIWKLKCHPLYPQGWDCDLENIAKAWSKKCTILHNDGRSVHPVFKYVGENIFAGGKSTYNFPTAVNVWFNEQKHYNYNSDSCDPGKVCGHYTQVVWAKTYRVGCARNYCPNGINNFVPSGTVIVCNYGPGGNVKGSQPYKKGQSCSECSSTCDGNLCHCNDTCAAMELDF
uniref:SCP domain-containing protein n=1 Tax=Eptatretus burgeri TaxID=7764 RepID=A0A8C4QNH2_EPTBU